MQWIDFSAARRFVQAAKGPICGPDDAGRWILERAVAGTVRAHPDYAEYLEEIFREHRAGLPGMQNAVAFRTLWSLADINAELGLDTPKKVGRPPAWPWHDIVAEAAIAFALAGGTAG
jgi:hypothetical protein